MRIVPWCWGICASVLPPTALWTTDVPVSPALAEPVGLEWDGPEVLEDGVVEDGVADLWSSPDAPSVPPAPIADVPLGPEGPLQSESALRAALDATAGEFIGSRLAARLHVWKALDPRPPDRVLQWIEFGYKLPWKCPPPPFQRENSPTTDLHASFVDTAVAELLATGRVTDEGPVQHFGSSWHSPRHPDLWINALHVVEQVTKKKLRL